MRRRWRIGLPRRVRTLVTQKARRGLSANEIACALISMMARSTCSNQRPNTLTQDRISQRRPKPLAPHGRTIHWVRSVALCNGRPRLDFRYTPLATKLARHCNMSRRARHFRAMLFTAAFDPWPTSYRVGLLSAFRTKEENCRCPTCARFQSRMTFLRNVIPSPKDALTAATPNRNLVSGVFGAACVNRAERIDQEFRQ
jgi:hypothetical protein